MIKIPGLPYGVWVGEGLLERAHELVSPPPGAEIAALVTDASAGALHAGRARAGLAPWGLDLEELTVEPGEGAKTAARAEALWSWLADVGSHRSDVIVALGGGVVGDLGGFVAATYHRGIAWVALPTTLLAMVDAAIGGKTAINLPQGKNLVGSFHDPVGVIADTTCLATLPDDEMTTGLAEVIKHGLIAPGDLLDRTVGARAAFAARDIAALTPIVADAAAVKVRVVAEDPTERGARAHLNYGHTLGHALETLGGYAGWTHGRAVAVGMTFAAHLAAELGLGDRVPIHRESLEAFGLPTGGAIHPFDEVAAVWARDKKYQGGVRFVVLEGLGRPTVVGEVPDAALRKAYEAVR